MFVLIKYDTDGFITDFKTTDTDGYTKTFLPDRWLNDFMKYSGKFRYDGAQLLNPGNLPATTITDLESNVTDLQKSSKEAVQTTDTLATGLKQVQQSVTSIAIGLATKGDE